MHETSGLTATTVGSAWAVIPTIGVGGPLAILALLFPSVFGGCLVLFRKWKAFLAVVSVASLLLLLQNWLAAIPGLSDLRSPLRLWFVLTIAIWCGGLWSALAADRSPASRSEYAVLIILSILATIGVLWLRYQPRLTFSPAWELLEAISYGIWVATVFRLGDGIRAKLAGKATLPWPSETIMLWVMGISATVTGIASGLGAVPESEIVAEAGQAPPPQMTGLREIPVEWKNQMGGVVFSSPAISGDRLYLAVAHQLGALKVGVVYCIEKESGRIVWTFDDDGRMKQVYSSPCVVDDRVYIGEGLHFDPDCKVYCLDAATGKKVWDFQTSSQTEATPVVAGGYVFAGAGNDGLYALDAKTGKLLWRFGQDEPVFRVGAGPAVGRGRVWFGSGVDRLQPDQCETAVVCCEARTGRELWKARVDLPVWASPVLAGDQLFVALGNGDILQDAESDKAGAILCLDPKTGNQLWRFDVDNGILGQPAVDARHVYFGSRNGRVYCCDRFNGQRIWERDMGAPVVAATVIDQGHLTGRAEFVFALATSSPDRTGGRITCFEAATGRIAWSNADLSSWYPALVSRPALEITPMQHGIRRRLYFGAGINGLGLPRLFCVEDLIPSISRGG